ncbi:MAG: hypothetical protein ACJ0US_00925 [Arenicellales bacterium]
MSGALGSLNGLDSDQLAPVNLAFKGNGVSGSRLWRGQQSAESA